MSYVIFGLGLLLAAAGCLGIYAGYDIVEVERGWTDVISGTTALTGGIVTIALSVVIRRLQSLTTLAKAPIHAPGPAAMPQAAVAPVSFAPPMQAPANASVIPARSGEPAPYVADAVAAPLIPPSALAEPEPIRQASAPAAAIDFLEAEPPQASQALSLDEMWKRVSGANEQPLSSLPETTSLTEEPDADAERYAAADTLMEEDRRPAAPPPSALRWEAQTHTPMQITAAYMLSERTGAELDHMLTSDPLESASGASEQPISARAAEFEAVPPTAPIEAPEPVEGLGQDAPHRFDWDAGHEAFEPTGSHLPDEPPAEAPLPADATPEPAVVGRYEADGTAYVMFADGSIEAQSEVGIFHFASMADLKAFIEDRQAAEV